MAFYCEAEDRMMACIAQKFGLPPEMPHSVKLVDRLLLATEFRDVTSVGQNVEWIERMCGIAPVEAWAIDPWPASVPSEAFLQPFGS